MDYRYEPRQREPIPVRLLPVVNPVVPPRPSGRSARISKLANFLIGAGILTLIWFGIISQMGSITGSPKFDLFLWAMGVMYFFWGDILTDNNRRWAEKYCGLGRKGGG